MEITASGYVFSVIYGSSHLDGIRSDIGPVYVYYWKIRFYFKIHWLLAVTYVTVDNVFH